MKKVIALLVILLALSILAGCGNRLGGTASNEISIQEWLDNKGGTESSTMTVTVKPSLIRFWRLLKMNSVHL